MNALDINKVKTRCGWAPEGDALYVRYHDEEWGVPVWDDRVIFEFLVLESSQAGLSWKTVLNKRENYRKAFARFSPRHVARYTLGDVRRLLANPGIIRNRQKVNAAITNARQFLIVQKEFGSFARYAWGFVGGKPIVNRRKNLKALPATSREAVIWSKDLKARGFSFLGPTIVYAHMQATGMVNDHLVSCFRYHDCTTHPGAANKTAR